MLWKRIYAAWFGIHFLLITAVCFAGIFSLIAEGSTILPSGSTHNARKAEIRASWLLGKEAGSSSPVKQAIANHRLTLELFYLDGYVEYEAPHVRSKVAALRLDSLSDKCPRNVRSRSERQFLKCLPFRSDGSTRTGKKFEPLSRVSIYRGSQTSNAGKPKRLNQCSASISVCAGKNSSRRSLSVLTDFVCGSQCEAQSAA